jgi:hypothetical protein
MRHLCQRQTWLVWSNSSVFVGRVVGWLLSLRNERQKEMQRKEMLALMNEVVNKEKCWQSAMIGVLKDQRRERGSCK